MVGKCTEYTSECNEKGEESIKLQDCLSSLHVSCPDHIVFLALGVKEGILATAGRDEGLKRYRNGFRRYLTFIPVTSRFPTEGPQLVCSEMFMSDAIAAVEEQRI